MEEKRKVDEEKMLKKENFKKPENINVKPVSEEMAAKIAKKQEKKSKKSDAKNKSQEKGSLFGQGSHQLYLLLSTKYILFFLF